MESSAGPAQLAAYGAHALAIHAVDATGTHDHLSYALTPSFRAQLLATTALITKYSGQTPRLLRPPGGEWALAEDLARGIVTSRYLGPCSKAAPCAIIKGSSVASLREDFKTAGVSLYLGEGTSGCESWKPELKWPRPGNWTFDPDTRKGEAIDAIRSTLRRLQRDGGAAAVVVLAHDHGGNPPMLIRSLPIYIEEIERLARADGASPPEFVSMNQLASMHSTPLPCSRVKKDWQWW